MKKILFMRLGGAIALGTILSITSGVIIALTATIYKTTYSGLRETNIRLEGQVHTNTEDVSDLQGGQREINAKLDGLQKSLDRIEKKL